MLHEKCRKEYIKRIYHISESQFLRTLGLKELRAEISALNEYVGRRVAELQTAVDALERRKE
jgi:hypothetical protein